MAGAQCASRVRPAVTLNVGELPSRGTTLPHAQWVSMHRVTIVAKPVILPTGSVDTTPRSRSRGVGSSLDVTFQIGVRKPVGNWLLEYDFPIALHAHLVAIPGIMKVSHLCKITDEQLRVRSCVCAAGGIACGRVRVKWQATGLLSPAECARFMSEADEM